MSTIMNGTICTPVAGAGAGGGSDDGLPIYLSLLPILALIVLSGLFSGLTLGLMGLDKVGLEVVMASGTAAEKRYAKKIYPVRAQGNFLLCTLLLGNVAVNALLSILLADLTSGLVGFLLSTVLIVIFGEIMPQAVCSRYGLLIGSHTVWIVKIFMFLMAPIAWPISKILDKVLGHEVGTIYTKSQLKQLMVIHARERDSDLTSADQKLLSGVLDFSRKTVRHVMTPISKAFSISADACFDYETLEAIMASGYSRIPVHEGPDRHIDYLLVVKHLALLSPEDKTPIRTILQFYGKPVQRMFDDLNLDKALNQFKRAGHSNLALVQRVNNEGPGDPFYESVGIVTLEDVIEELIMDEIVDETDVYIDNVGLMPVDAGSRPNFSAMLRRRRAAAEKLSPQQLDGLSAYLGSMVEPFGPDAISPAVLKKLCARGAVATLERPQEGAEPAPDDYVYSRGDPADKFTVILQGKLQVTAGAEEFLSYAGPYTILGVELLDSSPSKSSFVPNFTAVPSTPTVQIWQITRAQYDDAAAATQIHDVGSHDPAAGIAHMAGASAHNSLAPPANSHDRNDLSSELCSDDMDSAASSGSSADGHIDSPHNPLVGDILDDSAAPSASPSDIALDNLRDPQPPLVTVSSTRSDKPLIEHHHTPTPGPDDAHL